MNTIPESSKYVIIGAGIHGLSAGWHLAMELKQRGRGSGADIIILDKTGVGAGASGIACGCVRNLYMTEPLHAILRHSVDVWTYDPVAFGFQQVGYVAAAEGKEQAAYERVHQSQNAAGYPSDLYVGAEAKRFLKSLWPDFNVNHVDIALHEKVSGYAGTRQAVRGLAQKCADQGVRILSGVEVTGYDLRAGQVQAVHTNLGDIKCDLVIWGLGAWTPQHWKMLDKPTQIDCLYPDGGTQAKDMWTYWRLLEGEVYDDRPYLTAAGINPPVLHIETSDPVIDKTTGQKVGDYLYVYFKNGNERMDKPGLQGGTVPIKIGPVAKTDPYGHANDEYQAEAWFADYFTAAMAHVMSRFDGIKENFRERRNGGIGAFTPDNVPVFDWAAPNVYMIADSNHGFKMTGAGKLVARYLMGDDVAELKPFAFSRYAEGKTFGASNSHSPWV
jgi:glycine/D-amino acid oxidase-like deaminating enzyme